jgi:penicillin-binding protein 1A
MRKRDVGKKHTSTKRVSVYSNLAHKRRTKKDLASRRKAEYLATLPKHPVKRTLYRLHPKRVVKYWFSKRGLFMALKLTGVGILLMVLAIGALFAYFRKDLDKIRPEELANRVQTTVSRYYDRNGTLLWEDKGAGDYRIFVNKEDIPDTMRQATIAIEDKDFYHHGGISPSGLVRALLNNSQGDSVQGGSTLTQQLVKQVFFPPEEYLKRGLDGVPRKIKEIILSIEVERMYNKDQILNLYLNESSYGGRRNGVESASQTYFGKPAKELTLAESALLAAIPNQPGFYNPYNTDGNAALIERQHLVLKNMVEQGFITQKQADEAVKVPVLDNLKPLTDQYKDIKAPHFVTMVRNELKAQLGEAVVGRGGLTIKTTLDLSIQGKLEEEMANMFNSYYPASAGFTNGAATVEDSRTGQIIALMGSRDFNAEGFGQDNAAVAFIQPGSSIKPLVYAQLFQDQGQGKQNFGSGSILADTPFKIYNWSPVNADHKFKGNIPIRTSLATSRNIPAIKAMQVSGVDQTLQTIRQLGDTSYCTQGQEKNAGLASAIGGCGTRMVDHTNALASLARGGVYKPQTSILEVKNSSGEILKKYKDEQKQIINPQAAYIVNDIMGDMRARAMFSSGMTPNLNRAGVRVALKTGTSDRDGQAKDIWTVAWSPSLAMTVWLGNSDARILKNGNSTIPARILDPVMAFATLRYQEQGIAKKGEWFTKPDGIQTIGSEVYPSYYNKSTGLRTAKMTFDKVSKKLAADCTPSGARIEVGVTKSLDPITKKDVVDAPDGYDATKNDDSHMCSDTPPSVSGITINGDEISVRVSQGTFTLDVLDISVNDQVITTLNVTSSGTYATTYKIKDPSTVKATVTDKGFYSGSSSQATSGSGN